MFTRLLQANETLLVDGSQNLTVLDDGGAARLSIVESQKPHISLS
jgi:hypothetical protein